MPISAWGSDWASSVRLDDGRTVDGDRRAAAATEAAVTARDDVERVEIVAREADAAFAVGRGRDVGCGERAARQVDRGNAADARSRHALHGAAEAVDRKNVGMVKSGSVRVGTGCRRCYNNKNNNHVIIV